MGKTTKGKTRTKAKGTRGSKRKRAARTSKTGEGDGNDYHASKFI